jgi:hypothetical protein
VSAPPVGPLAGATRVRPDGWLAHPLTTDVRCAEDQARVLLARHHGPHHPGVVRCLTARYGSATFTLGEPPQRLFKQHADEGAYLGEVLAYQLLAGDDVLPAFYGACDDSRTLILGYLPEAADLRAPGAFEELINAVAAVHTTSARWDGETLDAMAVWHVGTALTAASPAWITQPEHWRRVLRAVAESHGPCHVPLGHLDLKPEHARRHPDGRIAIIDAETLRPDLTGLPDLITLGWLARDLGLRIGGPAIRSAYRERINLLGAQWSDSELVAALHEFADATGLRCLHDVAS